jgi:hypothetical protein
MSVTEWVSIVVTAILGVAGLYLGNSYRRRAQVELAEARRTSYSKLWEITKTAAPTRLRPGGAGLLTRDEREKLFTQMTDWYYDDGNGMLLAAKTRALYLSAKHNLTCADEDIKPNGLALVASFPSHLTTEQRRGCLSIRQLSLLRTQMKSDLAVYGRVYSENLRSHEREFLRHCGMRLWRRPWRASSRGQSPPEDCNA